MNKEMGFLKWIVWASVAIALLIVVLFETHVLEAGALAGDAKTEFVVLTVAELLALALIPFAVGLFRIKYVRNKVKGGTSRTYGAWVLTRLGILSFLLLANTLCYYLFASVAFGYLAIIACLCMLVVFPTKERCANEMGKDNNES
ncbi:MAG: hypothetical protein IKT00_06475 [Prevotella sp.]|nr:hypothetical protein [Prevotella sp.]